MNLLRTRRAVAVAIGYPILYYWAHYQAVQPGGSRAVLDLVSLLALLAFPLTVVFAVAALREERPKRRRAALVLAGVSLFASLTSFGGFSFLHWRVRHVALARCATQLAPLIHAIRAYQRDRGASPETLHAIVPDYLPALPSTGLGAYQKLMYVPGPTAAIDDAWALSVPTPLGFLNRDQFIYVPSEQYPTSGLGGVLEQVGRWAYVHD